MSPTAPSAADSSTTRRTVLRGAAWSAPVIAAVACAPLAAATAAVDCTVSQGAPWTARGTLHSDGRTGSVPTTNGQFGTGWTPPLPPIQSSPTWPWTYAQNSGAVAPDPASWWNGGGSPGSALGFLSLDDNNNTDANTA